MRVVTIPISYLLLDTWKCEVGSKHGVQLTAWLCALCDNGFRSKYIFTDKDFAEINAIKATWPDGSVRPKLCLWHALKSIKKHVLASKKPQPGQPAQEAELADPTNQNMNDILETFQMASIQKAALPEYLHWFCDWNSDYYKFYCPIGGVPKWDMTKPLLNAEEYQALMALC